MRCDWKKRRRKNQQIQWDKKVRREKKINGRAYYIDIEFDLFVTIFHGPRSNNEKQQQQK